MKALIDTITKPAIEALASQIERFATENQRLSQNGFELVCYPIENDVLDGGSTTKHTQLIAYLPVGWEKRDDPVLPDQVRDLYIHRDCVVEIPIKD